jgi:hypothetical protein
MASVWVEELGVAVFVDDCELVVLTSDPPLLPNVLDECLLACEVHQLVGLLLVVVVPHLIVLFFDSHKQAWHAEHQCGV